MPLVTVNIPTYQRDEMLRRAIASVLCQTFTDIEVNVSDNAGSPQTRALVESFDDPRLTYLPLVENIGMHGNFTRCLHLGGAPFVQIVADDDVLYPESIERRLHALQAAPAAAIAHSAFDYIDGEGHVTLSNVNWADATGDTYERGAEFTTRTLLGRNRICVSAALMRREAIATERIDPRDGGYSDMALWLRVARSWDVVYIHQSLLAFAMHEGSASTAEGWHEMDANGHPKLTRDEVQLFRDDKIRFVDEYVSGRRAKREAMQHIRKHARHQLKSIVADRLEEQTSTATIRDLGASARIEPTLLLTPWPVLLAAAGIVGRGPYDRLVARRTPR